MKRAILLLSLGLSLTTDTFCKKDIPANEKEGIVSSEIKTSPTIQEILSNYNEQANERLTRIALKKSKKQAVILVDKLNRQLYLLKNKKIVQKYPIELGFNPLDDKMMEWDGCTPEGEYIISIKKGIGQSSFYKAFLISYPSIKDAERGLKSKLIDQKQYNQIINAIKNKEIPNQDTKLGGLIEIHGSGGKDYNWTLGCIALKNEAMDSLDRYVEANSPVIIVRKIRNNQVQPAASE